MSIVTRLIGLVAEATRPADPTPSPDVPDERLAAAALLVHVARVDGRMEDLERRALVRLLHDGFGLADDAAERFVTRADALDREVDDIASLIDMMGHSLDDGNRQRLLAMAWEVAAADGTVQEFEHDLLWRMGQLLGLPDGDRERIGEEALRRSQAGRD